RSRRGRRWYGSAPGCSGRDRSPEVSVLLPATSIGSGHPCPLLRDVAVRGDGESQPGTVRCGARSPARTGRSRVLPGGGSGQVPKSVNAQGGLVARLKSIVARSPETVTGTNRSAA